MTDSHFAMSDAETRAVLESLVRSANSRGYPDGIDEKELLAKYEIVHNDTANARVHLAAIQAIVEERVDVWVNDQGRTVYSVRGGA